MAEHGTINENSTTSNTAALWTSANPFERSLQDAVDFVVRNVKMQIGFLPSGKDFLKGKTLIEIGPGQDFGIPLVMMGYGAQAILVDKYLCSWDNAFHPHFYTKLRQAVIEFFPDASTEPLDKVIANNEHKAPGLKLCKQGLESVPDIETASIDLSISNAVFEHFFDGHLACLELGRITRKGGYGFHQTDFRDHRNFDRPLEYLTMSPEDFKQLLIEKECACGNRLRYTDFLPSFEKAGFDVRFEPNMFAELDYLNDIMSRAHPYFSTMEREAFRVLSGRFHLAKR